MDNTKVHRSVEENARPWNCSNSFPSTRHKFKKILDMLSWTKSIAIMALNRLSMVANLSQLSSNINKNKNQALFCKIARIRSYRHEGNSSKLLIWYHQPKRLISLSTKRQLLQIFLNSVATITQTLTSTRNKLWQNLLMLSWAKTSLSLLSLVQVAILQLFGNFAISLR